MIISHSKRFIFIKTRKTAGSSLQAVLASHCDANDIVTAMASSSYRGYVGRNWEWLLPLVPGKASSRVEHVAAIDLERAIRKELPGVWDDYFKISIERNPWDKAVSEYWWRFRTLNGMTFDQWLPGYINEEGCSVQGGYDHRMYCHADGTLMVDCLCRWESLDRDYPMVCGILGVPEVELPRLKSASRTNPKHYSRYYNDTQRDAIARKFARVIDICGYVFEDQR